MSWDSLKQDLRYTFRTLGRDAGFFTAAVLIIAVGIGANTAIFSIVNTLLFRPLRFGASERLVWIRNTGGDGGLSSLTTKVANYLDWKRSTKTLEDMTAYFAFFDYETYTMVGQGEPERLVGVGVAENFLPFLGVRLELGRNFDSEESKWNGRPATILTHALWQNRFAGDRNIVGRSITLSGKPTTIIGVLPASFDFSSVFTPGSPVQMLIPFPLSQETDSWGNTLAVLGRLKPRVTPQQAQAEFDVMNEQLRRAHPDRWGFGANITMLQDYLTSRFRRGLLLLLFAVGAVLLIACTNLSNLLLARAASRRKELAIRSALGASRTRLVRQMLTESLMLSTIGGIVGLTLAYAAIRSLGSFRAISIPLLHTATIDGTALVFTVVASVLTGLLFGLVPAFQSSNANESESLKDAGRGLSEAHHVAWTRSTLVVAQVAMACVLLVGAGLLIRSMLHVLETDLGFRPERTAVWRIDTGGKYENAAQQRAFYERLVQSVQTMPGVESAGVTDALPLSRDRTWGLGAKGVSYPKGQYPLAHPRIVDSRYIPTMRIPLVSGRNFEPRDTDSSEPVIILNEKAARALWPGQNPIGQMVNFSGSRRVIGVVGNVRHQALEKEGGLEAYLPITQARSGSVELVVRARMDPAALAPSVRSALRGVDPSLPTAQYQELRELIDRAVSPRRFLVLLLGAFALAALVLAATGIYGVVAYTVEQRTQEIGIRMALGASAMQVQRHVMGRTVALVTLGIAIGLAGAAALARLTASLLYELQPGDPLTFATTTLVLFAVALLAGFVPALRASRVDPMSALRTS